MTSRQLLRAVALVCGFAGVLWLNVNSAQETKPETKTSTGSASKSEGDVRLPVAAPGDQVVIKRDPVRAIDPLRYRVSLYLAPIKTITLVAPFDGTVKNLTAKIGESLPAQSEAVRLDNTVSKFHVQRAQGLYKAAVLEQKLASDG